MQCSTLFCYRSFKCSSWIFGNIELLVYLKMLEEKQSRSGCLKPSTRDWHKTYGYQSPFIWVISSVQYRTECYDICPNGCGFGRVGSFMTCVVTRLGLHSENGAQLPDIWLLVIKWSVRKWCYLGLRVLTKDFIIGFIGNEAYTYLFIESHSPLKLGGE